jgi:hypothetical protein
MICWLTLPGPQVESKPAFSIISQRKNYTVKESVEPNSSDIISSDPDSDAHSGGREASPKPSAAQTIATGQEMSQLQLPIVSLATQGS